jgi:hypothetical protein
MQKKINWAIPVLWCALVFFFVFPLVNHTADTTHDFGSQAAIEYWLRAGLPFGTHIIQNVGPYGFVSYPAIFTGLMDGEKLGINVALTALFVILLWSTAEGRSIAFRCVLVALVALFAREDAFFYLLVLLLAYALLCEPWRRSSYVLVFVVALLGQSKGTFLALGGLVALALVAQQTLERQLRRAGATALCFLASFLVLWLAAGQDLRSIPPFVVAAFTFAQGYNNAMQIFEPAMATFFGAALCILYASTILVRAAQPGASGASRRASLLFGLVQMAMLYVVWKHGYVRADKHVLVFVNYVCVAAFLSIWSFGSGLEFAIPRGKDEKTLQRTVLAALASIAIVVLAYRDLLSLSSYAPAYVVRGKGIDLVEKLSALSGPGAYVDGLRDELDKQVSAIRDATAGFRETVGDAQVGYMGIYPGLMVYSGMRYVPLPSTISFAAWNANSAGRDAAFLADPAQAPRFVVVDLSTIDNRFVPQDDAPAKLELLRDYRLVRGANGWALLERRSDIAAIARTPLDAPRRDKEGWVDVPPGADPLWVAIHVERGLAYTLVSALYKPPEYFLDYRTGDGKQRSERLVLSMGELGFLIRPLIVNFDDLYAQFEGSGKAALPDPTALARRVTAFRVRCGEHLAIACDGGYQVQMSAIGGLPL